MFRHKMNHKKSKRYFSNGASRIHRKNLPAGGMLAMRGGIRL